MRSSSSPGVTVRLPTIKATGALVKPRHVRDGELAHVRFEFAERVALPLPNGATRRARTHYTLAPAAVAREWEAKALSEFSATLVEGFVGTRPEALRGGFVAVRLRFGRAARGQNFLVPETLAREWLRTALKFERLYDDYQRMMKGGR